MINTNTTFAKFNPKNLSLILFLCFTLCFSINGNAQKNRTSSWDKFEQIKNVKSKDIGELALLLTRPYEDMEDKVKAIYYWTTHNIKYDKKRYEKYQKIEKKRRRKRYSSQEMVAIAQKDIKKALKKKRGVHMHYALIFRALCENINIDCEYVEGHSRNVPRRVSSMGEKHAWNVFKLNNEWKFVDATYGSGFINKNEIFAFKFDSNYYDAKPEVFMLNHFPKDERWQLAKDTAITKDTYKTFPVIGRSFLDYNVTDLAPMNNVIEVNQGDPIKIDFKTNREVNRLLCINVRDEDKAERERVPFTLGITEDNDNTIEISSKDVRTGTYLFILDNKPLFAYRLKIKK